MANTKVLDAFGLAQQIREEQIIISSEKQSFGALKEEFIECSSKIYKLAWVSARQRQNLSTMILARPDVAPTVCSQRSMQIEHSQFIDVYQVKSLKHQHLYGFINLLAFLKNSPILLAECMAIADQIGEIIPSQNESIVQIICDGLYGSLIDENDVDMVLQILDRLIDLQIVNSENFRKILRPGSSSFSRLYQRLHESIPSAKLFLVAALYEPVMSILVEEVKIDLKNAVEGIIEVDKQNIQKLFMMAVKFVTSLNENWQLFPPTLRQLVQKLVVRLQQNSLPERTIHCMVTDLIFTYFICPAVCSPDLFGVVNVQIDSVARHNLIQIGQIIQKLALQNYEPLVDERSRKLYEKFESDVIHKLILQIISVPEETHFDAQATEIINIRRDKIFITRSELNLLLDFLRTANENDGVMLNTDNRKQLIRMLNDLPIRIDQMVLVDYATDGFEQKRTKANANSNNNFNFSTKQKLTKAVSMQPQSKDTANVELFLNPIESRACSFINGNIIRYGFSDEVLVFPIKPIDEECLNLLREDEIFEPEKSTQTNSNTLTEKNIEEMSLCNEVNQIMVERENEALTGENDKESRFEILRDDASIGNASDNLEAASEAASNRSGSSIDLEENLEDQNDNLSDMVSANVSGRGSPNISGRDTPSSQVTENSNNPIPAPQMVQMMTNKNRSDIQDKFCKFEIKKLIEGDETISIISDTWSTDVLASDSEAVEAPDRNFATPLIPSNVILPGDHNYDPMISTQFRHGGYDISETQSESAWSTDVLASDSEKVNEVDNEDLSGAIGGFNLRTPDSPFFSCKIPKVNKRTPTSARTPESPFSSASRSYDESPKDFDGAKFAGSYSRSSKDNSTNNNSTNNHNSNNLSNDVGESASNMMSFFKGAPKMKCNDSRKDLLRQSSSDVEQVECLIDVGACGPNVNSLDEGKMDSNFINIIRSDPNIMNPFFEDSNHSQNHENGVDLLVETRYSSTETRPDDFNFRRNGVIGLPSASDDLIKLNDTAFNHQQNPRKMNLNLFDKEENFSTNNSNKSVNPIKQSRSTGTIPKSISFDSTADKSQSRRGGLLNKIKGFANMKNRRNRAQNNEQHTFENLSTSSMATQNETLDAEETSDDILGKYRRKISTSSDPATSESTGSNSSSIKSKSSQSDIILKPSHQDFDNVKIKITTVLSKTKTPSANVGINCRSSISPITTYLKSQMSDAIISQNLQSQSYTMEALRCLGPFNSVVHAKLLQQVQIDLIERQRYTQYLLMRRKQLLLSLENLKCLGSRISDDTSLYMRQLILHTLNIFIEKRSNEMQKFYQDLSGLTLSDEKIELLEEFVKNLIISLRADGILKDVLDAKENEVKDCMERLILQHAYTQLMFPNDDVDKSRDLVLREHIIKLSKIITPSHKLLRIPSEFLSEAPWPLAQQQILQMAAFRKPIEKVLCVVRACLCIMHLLSISNQKPPAADDLTPVLIYVIIMANPPHLLSTIQFVNNFIGDRLEGEESYWWTQFVTCVEFIKTMD